MAGKPRRMSGPRASRKPLPPEPRNRPAIRLQRFMDKLMSSDHFTEEEWSELNALVNRFGAEQFNRGYQYGIEEGRQL